MVGRVRRWLKGCGLFCGSLILCLVLQGGLITFGDGGVIAQPTLEQGTVAYQSGNFLEAIALWEKLLPQIAGEENKVAIYKNLALAYRYTGQLSKAIAQWEAAIAIYRDRDDRSGEIARLLTEQAQAYSDLGQHRRAIALLESALEITDRHPDLLAETAIWGALGNARSFLAEYDEALIAHQTSLEKARALNDPYSLAIALNNLGNLRCKRAERLRYQVELAELEGDRQAKQLARQEREEWAAARRALEESLEFSRNTSGFEEIRGLINLNNFIFQESANSLSAKDAELVANNWNRARRLLAIAPDSREKVYGLINLAEGFRSHPQLAHADAPYNALERALSVAQAVRDLRAQSFALGSLGELYERDLKAFTIALDYSRQAQFAAQQINAPDSLYRWQWQAGRIFKATGRRPQAIAAYKKAIATLQSIRSEVIAANKDLQLDFRQQVEPVYRDLIALLLDEAIASGSPNTNFPSLAPNSSSPVDEALETLESFKIAEIQNFFGDDCVQVALSRSGNARSLQDTNTAVIYSIILGDRTHLILQAPDGTKKHYPVPISKTEIEEEVSTLRFFLETRATEQYIPHAQKVYDWFIRPLEAELAALQPDTLLFINDGVLRNISMAALHDGRQFLIQKYPIAITPSLNLTALNPLERDRLAALSLGLTVAQAPFAPLTNVRSEIEVVREIIGGIQLFDEAFTPENLQRQIQQQSFPVVHLATHGKFGFNAENTFLLGYNSKLTIEELDRLLRSRGDRDPVALLVMSACQTAAGDERSALGIGGVAVRAGVEAAVATLWFINDEATVPLIKEFYTQLLNPEITKAEALRRAQIRMIEDVNYSHPAVWSPFILIGNWL